jgi:hypothetical protein
LGIALAVSLHFRIMNGCLTATAFWALQMILSEAKTVPLTLVFNRSPLTLDLIRMGLGGLLLLYAFLRWNTVTGPVGDSPED